MKAIVVSQLDYVAAVERESEALAAAADGNWGADIVACPGWDVADLVWHVREVQWVWGEVVRHRLSEPPEEQATPPRPDDPQRLLADFRTGAAELCSVLRAADPAEPCWTWAAQKDAAFVIRHQAQEVAVHRVDAEHAAGRETPIDAAVAADAVDEFLTFSTGFVLDSSRRLPGPVRLEATDVPGAWTVKEDEDRTLQVVALGHGGPGESHASAPVTTVRGTASDLLLGLYRRVGPDRFSIEGDAGGWPALIGRNDLD